MAERNARQRARRAPRRASATPCARRSSSGGSRRAPSCRRSRSAQFFGVSRTIVRQALRTLAHEGIVALRDRRVAVVARPSPRTSRTCSPRGARSSAAVVEAVVRARARTEVAALRRLVRDEEAAYRRGDRAGGLKLSLALPPAARRAVRQPGARPLPDRAGAAVVARGGAVRASRSQSTRTPTTSVWSTRSRKRDAKRAARLMAEHLTDLERRLDADAAPSAPSLAAIFGGA